MNTFKITFKDRNTIVTGFNGDLNTAENYYPGKYFNLGAVDEEEYDEPEEERCSNCGKVLPWPEDGCAKDPEAEDEI